MFFNLKKCKFLRLPRFRFSSTPKIENSEISESFILLQFLVVYETRDPKTKTKNDLGQRKLQLYDIA